MTSQKQIDANRANAKSSTGPLTPEGKATVAGNAVTHGFAGGRISPFDREAQARLKEHKASFSGHYRPSNPVEEALVNDIAVARTRIEQIEIKLAELEMLGVGFDHHAIQLLHRYLRDAHRTWDRSRKAIEDIRRHQVRDELQAIKTQAALLAAEVKASEPLRKELALLRQSLDKPSVKPAMQSSASDPSPEPAETHPYNESSSPR